VSPSSHSDEPNCRLVEKNMRQVDMDVLLTLFFLLGVASTPVCLVFGEITTTAHIDYQKVVRDCIKQIGYTSSEMG
jgi:hypothetical protein